MTHPRLTALSFSLALSLTPKGRYILIYLAINQCMKKYYEME